MVSNLVQETAHQYLDFVSYPARWEVSKPVVLMRKPSVIRTGLLHPVLLFFSEVML